jgi:hypothetical protein
MPADLKVVGVKLPPVLRAPCTIVVQVAVENMGSDPADPVPYDVTVEIKDGEALLATFEAIVLTPEEQRLTPGRVIRVPVEVRLPCTSPITLVATVDKKQQIPNNARMAGPSLTLAGLVPTLVPWLTAALRVGISNASGLVTFDPDEFCPGKTIVAEAVIRNEGCIPSKPSRTEVTLEDANTVPFPASLTTHSVPVPALLPGQTYPIWLSFTSPASTAGFSGALAVRVSADVDRDNPDQCDRNRLEVRIVKPFSGTGGPPQLTLTVGGAGAIRPREVPSLSWSIRNECSEIGGADVRILFGTPPTELYKTQLLIPLRSTVERDLAPADITIPPTIRGAFWSVGLKSLELEITGSGSAGGPYTTTALLNVIPEPIDDTWWTWAMPPTPVWKSGYVVGGTFTNSGLADMTLSALSVVEHPTDVTGSSQDMTIPNPASVGMTVMPPGSLSASWSSRQSWEWLLPVTFIEVGARSRTFSYTANYSLTDEFGNSYPMILSLPTTVTVAVSAFKISSFESGAALMIIGIACFAAAVVAIATLGYPLGAIVGAALGATAVLFVAGAIVFLLQAIDPPIPDFREEEPVLIDPRAWSVPEVDDESFHALRTLALLLGRVTSARVRADRYKHLAWAAYVDRAESTRIQRRDAALDELETLRRLVTPVLNAVDEADDKFERLLHEMQELPPPESLREIAARSADELHLNKLERSLIIERLEAVDEEQLRRSVEQARSDGLRAVSDIVRRLYETTASEFAEHEYLR